MSLQAKIRQSILDFMLKVLVPPPSGNQRAPFGPEEFKNLREALLSQNLCCIDGKMVSGFEREFATAYDIPFAVASTSGTAAIHVALGALDLNPCDEVITAPITDLGTVIPILSQNAIPVFADVDDTYNMDPADVERKITPRTRAIIVVHLFGNPCNLDAMVDIARRHKIPLIEDCSQAHMAEYKGRYVGTYGDIGCFSFQQSKHMTTGDGGMTITANKSYYERMKLFADKGYARKGWGARAYLFHAPNYRMTELVGAVGLAQLKKVKGVVDRRREMGNYLTELLTGIEGVRTAPTTPGAKHTYWMYPMELNGYNIQAVGAELRKGRVFGFIGYTGKPIYLCTESLTAKKTYGTSQFPFSASDKVYEYKEGLCPRAEETVGNLICLPLDESWNRQEAERVAGVISSTLKKMTRQQVTPEIITKTTASPAAASGNGAHSVATASSEIKRVGIIGCGQMGKWHLDSYKKNPSCKIVAVADTDFAKAQALAIEVGATPYSTHTEMIEKESLAGVSICTLPSTHRDIAIDVLNAGVHVLCEKPLAISVEQGKQMLKSADEHKVLLLTAFKFRYFDEVLKAKELIDRGDLGKILTFRVMFGGYIDMAGTWYAEKQFSGGGVIMDNGPHATDLLRFLLGEVQSVTAYGSRVQKVEVEDTAQLILSLANGAIGTIDLSWSNSIPARSYLEIYGENGTILLDGEGMSYKFKEWKEWKNVPREAGAKASFARQIDHFLESINGKPPTRLTNIDGLKSQILLEAAYESIQRGTKVAISNGESSPETAINGQRLREGERVNIHPAHR
jgi:dTDP-4-amino-4,6-dideoxygalactose transaminase/predicted dehydrogenase